MAARDLDDGLRDAVRDQTVRQRDAAVTPGAPGEEVLASAAHPRPTGELDFLRVAVDGQPVSEGCGTGRQEGAFGGVDDGAATSQVFRGDLGALAHRHEWRRVDVPSGAERT